jgi:hypothetical protein
MDDQTPTPAEITAVQHDGDRKITKFLSLPWILPTVTFLASALFMRYLNLIGRPDLFLLTFSNTSGIFAFISVFGVLVTVTLFVIVSPSLFLAAMSHQLRKEIQGEATDKLARAILFLGVGNIITLTCIFYGWVVAGLLLGPTLGVSFHFLFLNRHGEKQVWIDMFKGEMDGKVVWKANAFQYFVVLWFCDVMMLWPVLLAFPFVSTDSTPIALGILSFVAFGALLPGWVYCILESQKKSKPVLVSRFLGATVVLVFYIILTAPDALDRVLERAAVMTGLRIDSPQRYLVSIDQLDVSLLDNERWNTKEEKHGISLDAVVPFSFGDLTVLCPYSLKTREKLQEFALKYCLVTKKDTVLRLPALLGN